MQFSPLDDNRRDPYATDPTCRRCRHSLRGLPGLFCPQCGAERDDAAAAWERITAAAKTVPVPSGPRAVADLAAITALRGRAAGQLSPESSLPPWTRRFLSGPGTVFHTLLLIGCGAATLARALPGGVAPAVAVAVGLLVLLGLIWAVRAAAFLLAAAVVGWSRVPVGAVRRMAVVPLVMALTAGVVAVNLPSRALFRLSRPAMERWAVRVMRGDRAALRERWIGFYPAREISFTDDGIWFRTPWTMPSGGSGFVYSPDGRPRETEELSFRRRAGAWYEWTHDF